MAAQLRWLTGLEGSLGEDGDAILEHIADQLEAMARGGRRDEVMEAIQARFLVACARHATAEGHQPDA